MILYQDTGEKRYEEKRQKTWARSHGSVFSDGTCVFIRTRLLPDPGCDGHGVDIQWARAERLRPVHQ